MKKLVGNYCISTSQLFVGDHSSFYKVIKDSYNGEPQLIVKCMSKLQGNLIVDLLNHEKENAKIY